MGVSLDNNICSAVSQKPLKIDKPTNYTFTGVVRAIFKTLGELFSEATRDQYRMTNHITISSVEQRQELKGLRPTKLS